VKRAFAFLTRPLAWPKRVPLRTRLVASMLILVTVALAAISLVGVTALRNYQLTRVDSQLVSTASVLAGRVSSGEDVVDPDRATPLPLPGSFYIEVDDVEGQRVGALRSVNDTNVVPQLSLSRAQVIINASRPFNVSADDGQSWRVTTLPLEDTSLIVAVSLADVESTTSRLVFVDLAVSLAVLCILGIVASRVVRTNLTPLGEVEAVAGAIAEGDLSERVPEHDPRTEVGRLSVSLNRMLERLETAFDDRQHALDAATDRESQMRRFIADASHELRTPLTSIRGFAELARSGVDDDLPTLLRRVEDEASRMSSLVEDLLTLARLQAEDDAAPVLAREPVEVLTIALDVVDASALTHPDRHVELLFESSPVVTGDANRIHRVLSNLVTNALKYTSGDVEVGVSDGATVVLEVRDQGPGLSEADAKHVFERFYRADSSRTRASGGTGLGLAIVNELVRLMGGTITLETGLGRGSTFRVELPCETPEPSSSAAPVL
jgi:two-component system OmpR family sensor kinase